MTFKNQINSRALQPLPDTLVVGKFSVEKQPTEADLDKISVALDKLMGKKPSTAKKEVEPNKDPEPKKETDPKKEPEPKKEVELHEGSEPKKE